MAGVAQAEVQIYCRQRNISGKIVHGKIQLHIGEKDVAGEKRVAEGLGALQREGTKMILIKAVKGGSDLLYDSFYLFHAKLRFPVAKLTVDELRRATPPPPVIGACVARDFPVVQAHIQTFRCNLPGHSSFCRESIRSNEKKFAAWRRSHD